MNKIIKWFTFTGIILVAVFNPFSIALWADALVIVINVITKELIQVSDYLVIIGATLLAVSGLLIYTDRGQKGKNKLKALKYKQTQKAGQFIQ